MKGQGRSGEAGGAAGGGAAAVLGGQDAWDGGDEWADGRLAELAVGRAESRGGPWKADGVDRFRQPGARFRVELFREGAVRNMGQKNGIGLLCSEGGRGASFLTRIECDRLLAHPC